MFYIGQTVIVKRKPKMWTSFLCIDKFSSEFCPFNLNYPFKGKIKAIGIDAGEDTGETKSKNMYMYCAVQIGRHHFDLSELILSENISVAKRQTKLKVADIIKANKIQALVNSL